MKKNTNSLAFKSGQIIASVLSACFVAVVCGFILAVALKILLAMYGWVF